MGAVVYIPEAVEVPFNNGTPGSTGMLSSDVQNAIEEVRALSASGGFSYDYVTGTVLIPSGRQMLVFGGKLTIAAGGLLRILGKVRVTP